MEQPYVRLRFGPPRKPIPVARFRLGTIAAEIAGARIVARSGGAIIKRPKIRVVPRRRK